MEKSSLPQRGMCWRTPRGCVAVWRPAPAILVVALQNHGEASFVEPVVDAYRSMQAEGHIHLFFDAEHLTNYDSPLRAGLTTAFLPDRHRLEGFHVLLRSKIVAMGVSVANLALGGIVSVTNHRQTFRTALDSTLFALAVKGFSSNVLDALTKTLPKAREG